MGKNPYRGPLTDEERAVLAESWEEHRRIVARVTASYWRYRANDVRYAVEWTLSETYSEAIESIVSGSIVIPTSAREWLAISKAVRRRYWAAHDIVVDSVRVNLLGESDDVVLARVMREREDCEPEVFADILAGYAAAGLDASECPAWCAETIVAWLYLPNASYAERAAEFGLKREGWKSREAKAKSAIRRGFLAGLFAESAS